ncbi:rhamnogalacturonan acetylesterase [Gracilibacillus caseinilyticus]|uniref:Rhamnogalacturonan acetylesterase n=1 Tax=Gracilibacillus caseinilyticus TaxID=2932256 RepID=A0ABY4ES82_9BACI|nr:rhamnogalacturonan acetylesterase [Gracilibacillus caseinilyticus]UOQ47038.1 rhamnogalacturonan acetylesterase [Gracilibacillus caseinilyticus]
MNSSIFLASDSTCQTYTKEQAPQAGWGQFLPEYLPEYTICNHAIGGRSSRTFIEEGRLKDIEKEIQKGDYLLIQMGHNDATIQKPERYTDPYTDYKQYLKQYIEVARSHYATPVLITPVARLHYVLGEFLIDFNDYCNAMKEVAEEEECILLDLMSLSIAHLTDVGLDQATTYYMVDVNGTDYTHFTEQGANQIAAIIAKQLHLIVTA